MALAAWTLVACGSPNRLGQSTTSSAVPEAKINPLTSPNLAISLTPKSGPVGTVVHVTVTGCNDPAGGNHAVSFNNDATNVNARNDPNTDHVVPTRQSGQTLTGSYQLVQLDRTGGVAQFTVQCGATLRMVRFTLTGA